MNTPTIWTPGEVAQHVKETAKEISPGKWVPCRTLGYQGLCLFMRLKRAWMVFTGKADVLIWEGQ